LRLDSESGFVKLEELFQPVTFICLPFFDRADETKLTLFSSVSLTSTKRFLALAASVLSSQSTPDSSQTRVPLISTLTTFSGRAVLTALVSTQLAQTIGNSFLSKFGHSDVN
jgi:hypothetical protein